MIGAQTIFLKVVLLGESGVGKTALLNRFLHKQFTSAYKSTIGADFLTQEIQINDRIVTLQIWDTAGQERFNSMGKVFYRGADCCIFVFDVTKPKTLSSLEFWIQEFQSNAGEVSSSFQYLVVGNRIDLENERSVPKGEALEWCKSHGGLKYIETSAKTGENVDRAFYSIATEVTKLIEPKEMIKTQEVDLKSQKKYDGDTISCCANKF
uniref:Ras-related protein Rab-7b n=1 Tax=Arcella intermedia TaxID=1963864 RepID=A0A6B2LJB4_9EUKA